MDISYTLIVALMFITILSFGFANVLSSLTEILNRRNSISVSIVHLNWILLLLIIHFNLAWQAVLISTNDSWTYDTFLFVELGPILAFFTTRILAPSEVSDKEPSALFSNYLNVSRQFFLIFALIQAWGIGVDFVLKRGFTGSAVFNILLIVLSIGMAKSKSRQKHVYGVITAWSLYITAILLRGLGIIN